MPQIDLNRGMGADSPDKKAGSHAGLIRRIRDAQSMLDGLEAEYNDDLLLQQIINSRDLCEEEHQLIDELSSILMQQHAPRESLPQISRDARFKLNIVEDGWKVTIDIEPAVGRGKKVTVAKVIAELKAQGYVHGVSMEAINRVINQHQRGELVKDQCIVRGKPPKDGEDGYIELYCRPCASETQQVFKGFDALPQRMSERVCRAGDKIAICIPPIMGEDGYNALGEQLAAKPVKMESFDCGANVRVEGDYLIAEVDGTLEVSDGKISVRRILLIEKDVVGESTQIKFDGDVTIDGSVAGLAGVIASGDITIHGTVGESVIISTGGSVYLRQGVAGRNKAKVEAAQDIVARFAENATLKAGRDIILEVGAMHALMTASHAIKVDQTRGQITGGVAIAGERIEAKQFGNQNGVRTVLMCGYSPAYLQKRSETSIDRAACVMRLEKIQAAVNGIRRMIGGSVELSGKDQAIFAKLLQALLVAKRQLNKLDQASMDIGEDPDRPDHAQIRAQVMMHPGCECWIGPGRLPVQQPHRACRVFLDGDKAVIKPL